MIIFNFIVFTGANIHEIFELHTIFKTSVDELF